MAIDKERVIQRLNQGEPLGIVLDELGLSIEQFQSSMGPDFRYSQEWYDTVYHGTCLEEGKTFEGAVKEFAEGKYLERLELIFQIFKPPNRKLRWLEIGCHQGMTAFWIARKFPLIQIDMIDFSQASIEWCQKNFPFQNRARIWQCGCDQIHRDDDCLDEAYHCVSCLDVTEHLPHEIYLKMIQEIKRVLKPKGRLILMQGTAKMPSHIHVLTEERLVRDFVDAGFVKWKSMTYYPKNSQIHFLSKS